MEKKILILSFLTALFCFGTGQSIAVDFSERLYDKKYDAPNPDDEYELIKTTSLHVGSGGYLALPSTKKSNKQLEKKYNEKILYEDGSNVMKICDCKTKTGSVYEGYVAEGCSTDICCTNKCQQELSRVFHK